MSSIIVKPGQTAVGRTTTLIIMMIDAALGQLKDLGYERGFDDVEIIEGEDFPFITLKGKILFQIAFEANPTKGLSIKGDWVAPLPKKKKFLWLIQGYRWFRKKLSGSLE